MAALVEFNYSLATGSDNAYKAVDHITDKRIWRSIAAICVKTKRVEVVLHCFSKMGWSSASAFVRAAYNEPVNYSRPYSKLGIYTWSLFRKLWTYFQPFRIVKWSAKISPTTHLLSPPIEYLGRGDQGCCCCYSVGPYPWSAGNLHWVQALRPPEPALSGWFIHCKDDFWKSLGMRMLCSCTAWKVC